MRETVKPFALPETKFLRVSNYIFDMIMPELPHTEFKILCFILRQTNGWGETKFNASYSEIRTGTGIKSDSTISKDLQSLQDRSFIIRDWESGGFLLNIGFILVLASSPEIEEVDESDRTYGETEATSPKNGVASSPEIEEASSPKNEVTPKNGVASSPKNGVSRDTHILNTKGLKERTYLEITGGCTVPPDPTPPVSMTKNPDPYFLAFCEVCEIAIPFTGRMGEWIWEAVSLTKQADPVRSVEQIREFGRRVRREKPGVRITPAEIVDKWGSVMGNLPPPMTPKQTEQRKAEQNQASDAQIKASLAKLERRVRGDNDQTQQAETHSGVP